MIDRTSSWCMWLSSLHRHPNHMLSYLDRISRWLIAPADDACEWVTFIVIRTVCYLIETPADDWSHPAHYSCERVTFIVSIGLVLHTADDWSHPAHYLCERVTFIVSIGLDLHTCLIIKSMRSHQQMIDHTCRWFMWASNFHRQQSSALFSILV